MSTEKYQLLLDLVTHNLKTLLHLIEKGETYAKENNINEETILSTRLAPDMFPLVRQIQITTDNARRYLLLLAGREHIAMEDTEKTFAELRTRVEKTQAIIAGLTVKDFEGADERHITLSWMGEQYVVGKDFVTQQAIPNSFFHLVTVYDILRNIGVVIGKTDFITTLNMRKKGE